jgi:hypothetical protein
VVAVFLLLHLLGMPPDTDRTRFPARLDVAAPTLQSAPQLDIARYRAEKRRVLEAGAWLDPDHQHARIPIATAMDLLAQANAPAASQPERQP